jgi:mono/diheme cytochrome c family protein
LCLALVLLPWLFRLDGRPHADWQQFLGRFHPLVVHLPVGLLVLIPLLEVAGKSRPALREAAGFILGLALISCLGALTLGYLLAYGGGTTGVTVTRHMWGGIALSAAVLLCLHARPAWLSGRVAGIYPAALCVVMIALVWTAHQGGLITHGSNYLTAYMPAPVKHWLGSSRSGRPDSFYAKHIDPVFQANCVVCHGEGKMNGGLRVDSYELLMKGGKDGPVVIAGKPEKSLLLERVTLPANHKQFMPAEGRPPLKPEEIAWVKAWVQQGASPEMRTLAGIVIREDTKELPPQPVGDYSALMPEILQMEKSQGAKLLPVSSKASDGLILNTVDVASTFGDAQLVPFQKFAPYIVEADLGRTAITNASFDTLSKFTHLRALHLEGTSVTGDGIAKLAPLTQLTYLNLSGTKVTATAAAQLESMKSLRHIYLYNTPAQPAVATQPIASSSK